MTPELQIAELTRALSSGASVFAIHYACEGLAVDHPAAVSAISISTVPASSDHTWSIVDTAGDGSEVALLEGFYSWLAQRPDAYLVHWNMNKSEFGFGPLANRYRQLFGRLPLAHADDRLFDIDQLIASRYGENYVRNPRLSTLLATNGIPSRYALSGSDQAARFAAGAHGELLRCTSERARHIARLTELFLSGRLQTEASGPAVRFTGQLLDSVEVVVAVGARIRHVADQISRRHGGRATLTLADEYDYQDLVHALLRMFFDDVRAEDPAPKVAGGGSRVDFVLREVELGVELKAMRPTLSEADLGAELIVDATRYRANYGVRHLVCLVFDFERRLVNPSGIERDLTGLKDGLPVTVRVFH